METRLARRAGAASATAGSRRDRPGRAGRVGWVGRSLQAALQAGAAASDIVVGIAALGVGQRGGAVRGGEREWGGGLAGLGRRGAVWPGPARGLWVKKAEAGRAPALGLAATPQTCKCRSTTGRGYAFNSIVWLITPS